MAIDHTSLEEPAELIDGKLVLMIPLEAGGAALRESAKGISVIEGDCLKVAIPDWLAEMLKITDGSIVLVDNKDGKLNFRLSDS